MNHAELVGWMEQQDPGLLRRLSATMSPADFGAYADPVNYQIPRHIDFLNGYLLKVLDGTIKRLLVFGPPRHGKSELVTKHLPPVFLGLNPNKRVVIVSYEGDFAEQWGWRIRLLLEEHGPILWGIHLDPSSMAKGRWDLLNKKGGLVAIGVGGAIMGRGADLLVIDDPIKNIGEAKSETHRKHLWDWFKSTAMTRLQPDASVVVMMHRWHEDDLAGRIAEKWPQDWTTVRMPAIAEEGDQLGRKPGEALWPEQWPAGSFHEIRKDVETWTGEYQQRPAPEAGAIFHRPWFRYCTRDNGSYNLGGQIVEAKKCRHFLTVDLACSQKTEADFTVVAVCARTPDGQLVVRDIRRKKLEGPDQLPEVEEAYRDIHDLWPVVHIESVQYQQTLVQAARRKGLPAAEIKRSTDKLTRALPLQAMMKAGKVWFMAGAPWVDELEHELMFFPDGKHDDQVDVLADGAHLVAGLVTPKVY